MISEPRTDSRQKPREQPGLFSTLLGTAEERWLPAASREHRGAGVTVFVRLPQTKDIAAVHERHAAGGVVSQPLSQRPWGELAFDAVIAGYRFLIGQEPVSGDV
jgi:hypothetical protein